MYYGLNPKPSGLMNLSITLGAVAIMLVAYWLFKWANVRPPMVALGGGAVSYERGSPVTALLFKWANVRPNSTLSS